MKRFIISVTYIVNVEAQTEETAKAVALRTVPYTNGGGCGKDGSYSFDVRFSTAKINTVNFIGEYPHIDDPK